jgi:CheY-like chemotaxis protein
VGDDDPAFRMLLRLNLELEGYKVLEAANAAEVKALLNSDDVDLLLLDVRLGDDDGLELAAHVRSAYPGVAIAFLTGSAFGLEEQAGDLADAVMQKPFTLEALSETVAQLTQR